MIDKNVLRPLTNYKNSLQENCSTLNFFGKYGSLLVRRHKVKTCSLCPISLNYENNNQYMKTRTTNFKEVNLLRHNPTI